MVKTITHKNNIPYFGDEKLLDTAQKNSFSDVIYELLSSTKPDTHQSKIFNLILNISIDHGNETPSAVEVIKNANEEKSISESVSAGILQINNIHGGAIEPAMELFYKIKKNNLSIKDLINEFMKKGERISGFGHRIYEVDPRTELIFKMATEESINNKFIKIAEDISKELSLVKNRKIPVNIDGAIAAILCSFGWKSNLGKAVFIIARTPGLCGQYLNSVKTK